MTIDEQKVHGHGSFVHQAVRVVDYNKSFNAPGNNPPGGTDLPVTQAYCNYVTTGKIDGTLSTFCAM